MAHDQQHCRFSSNKASSFFFQLIPPSQSCWLSSTTSLLAGSSAALTAGSVQAAPARLQGGRAPPAAIPRSTPILPARAQPCTPGTPGARMGREALPDVSDRCTSAWKVPGGGGGARQQHQAMVAWQRGPCLRGDVAPVGRADATAAMATRRDAPVRAPEPPTSGSPRGHPGLGTAFGGGPGTPRGVRGCPGPPRAPAEPAPALAVRAGGHGRVGGSCPHAPAPARSLPWQMPDYKRATLQDDEGPEPAGDGSASPDSVEVRSAPAPPSSPAPSSPSAGACPQPGGQREQGWEPSQPWLSPGMCWEAAKMRQRLCPGHRPSLWLGGPPAPAASLPGPVPWAPAEGCPSPRLVTQPIQAPGSSRGGNGEQRGPVAPWCDGRSCSCPGGVSEGAGAAAEPPGLTEPAGAGALRRRRLPRPAARRRRRRPGHPVPQR